MKFLCEHCKAKYQIADEKVAGRTVRMKCRKCGNPIEVRAAVTETSVAAKPPDPSVRADQSAARPASAPRGKPLATSLSHAPATATKAAPPSGATTDQGALVSAFQRNVQQVEEPAPASMDLRELSAADEWYVAVNGVPVGPVRVGEVRRKAATGAVTEDSLCWQEGMEEWRAIRTVTELAAVVREAASAGKAHHAESGRAPAAPPPRARISSLPAAPRAQVRAPIAPPRSAVAATPRMMSADPPEEENVPTIVGRSPLLDAEPDPEPLLPRANGAPMHNNGVAHVADPFAAPAPTFGHDPFPRPGPQQPVEAAPALGPPIVIAPPRRGPPPYIAIALIAMGCCFGVTAAIVLFLRHAPQAVTAPVAPSASVAVTAPPSARPAASGVAGPVETVAAPVVTDAGGAKVASSTPRTSPPQGGTAGSSNSTKPATGSATDPALAALIAGTGNGPSTASGGGGPAGAQLSEDDVKRVVGMHSVGVKRTCWDRISTQTSSVNVTVRVNVGSSGQVSSATATGNDPVVAHCLEEEVRGWRFPGGGVAEIPFHFIRQ